MKRNFKEFVRDYSRNKLIIAGAFILMTALVVLVALWNVNFDISKIKDPNFLSNLAFIYGIVVFALFISIAMFDNFLDERGKGTLYEAKTYYFNNVNNLAKRKMNYIFRQYSHYRYLRNRENLINKLLYKIGFETNDILSLSKEQIHTLINKPLIVGELAFDTIDDFQYQALMKIKDGEIDYPEIDDSYYFSDEDKDEYYENARSGSKKKKIQINSIVYKLVILLLSSIIITSAVLNKSDKTIYELIFKAVSYVFTLYGGILSGMFISIDKANITTKQYRFKGRMIEECINDYDTGIFVPEDISEKVKQKVAMIQEAEEKAIKAVVETPTPTPTPTQNEDFELTEEELEKIKLERAVKNAIDNGVKFKGKSNLIESK